MSGCVDEKRLSRKFRNNETDIRPFVSFDPNIFMQRTAKTISKWRYNFLSGHSRIQKEFEFAREHWSVASAVNGFNFYVLSNYDGYLLSHIFTVWLSKLEKLPRYYTKPASARKLLSRSRHINLINYQMCVGGTGLKFTESCLPVTIYLKDTSSLCQILPNGKWSDIMATRHKTVSDQKCSTGSFRSGDSWSNCSTNNTMISYMEEPSRIDKWLWSVRLYKTVL